jgi:hypothetical protein
MDVTLHRLIPQSNLGHYSRLVAHQCRILVLLAEGCRHSLSTFVTIRS